MAHPRKRKRRRAHAPAGPVGGERDASEVAETAPEGDATTSTPAEPAGALPADEPTAEPLPIDVDAHTDHAASDDEVEPEAEPDDAQPVDGSDVDPAEAVDRVDGSAPKNGRPAPTNGQPARGAAFVRGAAGAAAARKVSSALRPRSSARGR